MLVGTKIISKITTKFRLIRKIHVVIGFFILFRDTCPGASCFFLFKYRRCRKVIRKGTFIYHDPFGEGLGRFFRAVCPGACSV